MKDIYINGKFLGQKVTGVQRCAIEIVKQLDIINPSNLKFHIICPSEIINKLELTNIDLITVSGKPSYYWEQIKLPKFCKKNKVEELLNFCNIAPIKFPGSCFIHDIAVIDAPKGYSWKQRVVYKYINKKNIKKYKNVFTVSNTMKNRIEEYYKISGINVVYNGSEHLDNIVEKKPKFDVPEKFYLAVGSMNPNKNFKSIIRIARNMPNDIFIICGGFYKSFQKENNDIPSNVKFVGYVDDSELKYLYKNCNAFLFPSVYEGFGIPPLEALKLGCEKVICNDIPVLRELYDGYVSFIDFNKANELSFDLLKLDTNVLFEKYSWKKSAEKIIEIYSR